MKEILQLDWRTETNEVSWHSGKTKILKTFDQLFSARKSMDETEIWVDEGDNYVTSRHWRFDQQGELNFFFDIGDSKILWKHSNQEFQTQCPSLEFAVPYYNQAFIAALTKNDRDPSKLLIYSLEAELLHTILEPEKYLFQHLSSTDNQASVVCEGGMEGTDHYGRNRFHFTINNTDGTLQKSSMAY